MRSPCMGCQERACGCHGRCEKYKGFRARCDAIIEARKRESDVVGYVVGMEDRTAEKKHRQRRK